MSTFFIADLHFGHKNCLAYDNREFPSIEAHDEALIERWNNAVGIGDDVWILGDISWYSSMKTIEIFKRLNGTKHLCIGNHDKRLLKNRDVQSLFSEIVDYKELQLDDETGIVLSHYPIPCYNNHYYGWYHLYGHVHISFEWNLMKQVQYEMRNLYGKDSRMYNVGCMVPGMDYTPRTLEEIKRIFDSKKDDEA
jgi:calcineurin-like phosphoesterase family protein